MINKIISILCHNQKIAFWFMNRDINKLAKSIYKVSKGAVPTCNKEEAYEIAKGILWNSPQNVITAMNNIE